MKETIVPLINGRTASSGFLRIDRIGSGFGVVIYDPLRRLAVGFHVLAGSSGDLKPPNPFMYANTAVPKALAELASIGGKPPFSVAVAGGAVMTGNKSESNTSNLVMMAIKEALNQANLKISMEQIGGNVIRSIVLDIDAGKIKIA